MRSLKLAFRLTIAIGLALTATMTFDQPANAAMTLWGICHPQQSGPAICGITCPGDVCTCASNLDCIEI